jgi:Zn-dependent peptidase ImmA (M78 family)
MPGKKVWKSAVARILAQPQKEQPVYDSLAAWFLAQAQKGLSPDHSVAMLAQTLRDSEKESDKNSLEQVDLFKICAKVGLAVHHQPLSVDALLQETESGYLAIINSMARQSRQRLSLAHEIGHLMLYQATGLIQAFGHVSPNERPNSESREIEELCDSFANELIMPSDAWQFLLVREGISLSTLKKLKDVYGVTTSTAARRMVEVSRFECAVIIWTPVYEGEALIKLDPVRCWEKITSGRKGQPPSIEPRQDFHLAGSPFKALENQSETIGKISIPINGTKGKYLAHSDIIDASHVMTLIIPEHFGWEVMFRKSKNGQASTLK